MSVDVTVREPFVVVCDGALEIVVVEVVGPLDDVLGILVVVAVCIVVVIVIAGVVDFVVTLGEVFEEPLDVFSVVLGVVGVVVDVLLSEVCVEPLVVVDRLTFCVVILVLLLLLLVDDDVTLSGVLVDGPIGVVVDTPLCVDVDSLLLIMGEVTLDLVVELLLIVLVEVTVEESVAVPVNKVVDVPLVDVDVPLDGLVVCVFAEALLAAGVVVFVCVIGWVVG